MSETKYESTVASSTAPASAIYRVVSNLSNIDRVKDLIPQDKISDIEADPDYVRFKVDGLGQKICIRVVDRVENDVVKFALENLPMSGNFWIQMKEVAPRDTRLKLTIKADIPIMFKMMLEKKIQEGLNQGVEMLAKMPFEQWQ